MSEVQQPLYRTVRASVALRAGPGLEEREVAQLPRGTMVQAKGEVSGTGWLPVRVLFEGFDSTDGVFFVTEKGSGWLRIEWLVLKGDKEAPLDENGMPVHPPPRTRYEAAARSADKPLVPSDANERQTEESGSSRSAVGQSGPSKGSGSPEPVAQSAEVRGDDHGDAVPGGATEKKIGYVVMVMGLPNYRWLKPLPQARESALAFLEHVERASGAPDAHIQVVDLMDMTDHYDVHWRAEFNERSERGIREFIGTVDRSHLLIYLAGYGIKSAGGMGLQVVAPDGSVDAIEGMVAPFLGRNGIASVTLLANLYPPDRLRGKPAQQVAIPNPTDTPWSIIAGWARPYPDPAAKSPTPELRQLQGPVDAFTRIALEALGGAATAPDGSLTAHHVGAFMFKELGAVYAGEHRHEIISAHHRELDLAGYGIDPIEEDGSNESVTAQTDQAALVDHLGRAAFAQVLGRRIRQARDDSATNQGAYMLHLHGPWGSGKSSVLNFLRQDLERGGWKEARDAACARRKNLVWWKRWADRLRALRDWWMRPAFAMDREEARRAKSWVVVDFNAWRHQRVRPPWWSLLQVAARNSHVQMSFLEGLGFRVKWYVYRVWADLLPVLAVIGLLIGTWAVFHFGTGDGEVKDGKAEVGVIETGLKILSPLITVAATIFAWNRSLFFGDSRSAKAATEMRTDVMQPVIKLFGRLVKAVRRPLIIFIDDLDRCEQTYVVELLEGIQTLFKDAPVTFLVAADRKWICTSYEHGYEKFCGAIGAPGRPLGHLFLEKMFQVSVPITQLSAEIQAAYWARLLEGGNKMDGEEVKRKQAAARRKAESRFRGETSVERMQERIETEGDEMNVQAMAEAAALQITTAHAQEVVEHRLQPFATLLEANPRSMKRLVNSFGLQRSSMLLERRKVEHDQLARWMILEMRWPLLADFIVRRPKALGYFGKDVIPIDVPKGLRSLFNNDDVQRVVGNKPMANDPDGVLTEDLIRDLVGCVLKDPPPVPNAVG